MNIEEIWKKTKEKYKKNTNIIEINIPNAKKFLILSEEKESNILFIWYIINCVSPLGTIILSFMLFGFSKGILLNVLYIILYLFTTIYASYKIKKCEKIIWILFAIGIFISIFSDFPILYIALIHILLMSIICFYEYIQIITIELALNNIVYFNVFLHLGIINIKE